MNDRSGDPTDPDFTELESLPSENLEPNTDDSIPDGDLPDTDDSIPDGGGVDDGLVAPIEWDGVAAKKSRWSFLSVPVSIATILGALAGIIGTSFAIMMYYNPRGANTEATQPLPSPGGETDTPSPPRPPTASFAIAVAGFAPGNEDDRLSRDVVRRVVHSVTADDLISIEVIPPSKAGEVSGTSVIDRGIEAAKIASRTGADLVIYEKVDHGSNSVLIGVFLTERALIGVEELGGHYEWTSGEITAEEAEHNVLAGGLLADEIGDLTYGIVHLVVGVAYRDTAVNQRALYHLSVATEFVPPGEFEALSHLLAGNAALRVGRESLAYRYYESALNLTDRQLLRARSGTAETLFLTAGRGCRKERVDVERLNEARNIYESVLAAKDVEGDPFVVATAKFGLGRIFLCLNQSSDQNLWDAAQNSFEEVVALYDAADEEVQSRLHHLGSEASANLGLIGLLRPPGENPEDEWVAAVVDYQQALAINRFWTPRDRERRALFRSILAFLETSLDGSDVNLRDVLRLPPSFLRRQLFADQGSEGIPCDMESDGPPRIELLVKGIATREIEVGESHYLCFPGFDEERSLHLRTRAPGGNVVRQIVRRANYGKGPRPFLPSDSLGRYTLVARQGRSRASLTFELVEPARPVLFTHESRAAQRVYLAGYVPGTVVLVSLYEDPLVVVIRGNQGNLETSLKYTGTLLVVPDQTGTAVLTFPPTTDPCTIYRLGSNPVGRVGMRASFAPRICV